MNRNRLPLLCSLVLLGALTPECAEAQSLFAKRPKGTPDPYSDRTAHRSGDLITILVREKQKVLARVR